jgi:hypothetical protein
LGDILEAASEECEKLIPAAVKMRKMAIAEPKSPVKVAN